MHPYYTRQTSSRFDGEPTQSRSGAAMIAVAGMALAGMIAGAFYADRTLHAPSPTYQLVQVSSGGAFVLDYGLSSSDCYGTLQHLSAAQGAAFSCEKEV